MVRTASVVLDIALAISLITQRIELFKPSVVVQFTICRAVSEELIQQRPHIRKFVNGAPPCIKLYNSRGRPAYTKEVRNITPGLLCVCVCVCRGITEVMCDVIYRWRGVIMCVSSLFGRIKED